ncbi:MAG TPA: hypothetical protein DEB39_11990 [Planctomycetaceae bacterium]|nr:hypothetical protein [Planctomycetaceae bacterium]
MIILKRIISVSHKSDGANPEASVTFHVFSDEWRDGPFQIAYQGISDTIIDADGKVNGWLRRREMYRFGNDYDGRIGAAEIEVSERKIIDGDDEYEIVLNAAGVELKPNTGRTAIIRWTVRQTFRKPSPGKEEPENEPAANDPITVRISREFVEVPFLRDVRTGKLIVNSVGDPFIPTPMRQAVIRNYSVTRKERANPYAKADLYENVVNSDDWYGAAPGEMLLTTIDPDFDGSSFTVTYNFKYKKGGWGEKILDTGLRKFEVQQENGEAESKYVPVRIMMQESNTPVEEPVRLDGHGFPLEEENTVGVDLPLAGFFWKYREMPFAALKLPNIYQLVSRDEKLREEPTEGETDE